MVADSRYFLGMNNNLQEQWIINHMFQQNFAVIGDKAFGHQKKLDKREM